MFGKIGLNKRWKIWERLFSTSEEKFGRDWSWHNETCKSQEPGVQRSNALGVNEPASKLLVSTFNAQVSYQKCILPLGSCYLTFNLMLWIDLVKQNGSTEECSKLNSRKQDKLRRSQSRYQTESFRAVWLAQTTKKEMLIPIIQLHLM